MKKNSHTTAARIMAEILAENSTSCVSRSNAPPFYAFPKNIIVSGTANIADKVLAFDSIHFFNTRPLLRANFEPKTIELYSKAFKAFQNSLKQHYFHNMDTLDEMVEAYVNIVFDTDQRPATRQEMANLLAMLLIIFPDKKASFSRTGKALAGWKLAKPPNSATPLTRPMLMAYAAHLLCLKRAASATVLLISYGGCLRVGEALKLKWKHVALPGDPRLSCFPPRHCRSKHFGCQEVYENRRENAVCLYH